MKHLLIALLLSTGPVAYGAKTLVAVKCEPKNNDTVGSQLCTAVRDAVALSPRYREADHNATGWSIEILTGTSQENINTAASMVVIFHGIYADHELKVCGGGESTIKRCAAGFLASFDDDVTTFHRAVAEDHLEQ
jgi:hypothetical protein